MSSSMTSATRHNDEHQQQQQSSLAQQHHHQPNGKSTMGVTPTAKKQLTREPSRLGANYTSASRENLAATSLGRTGSFHNLNATIVSRQKSKNGGGTSKISMDSLTSSSLSSASDSEESESEESGSGSSEDEDNEDGSGVSGSLSEDSMSHGATTSGTNTSGSVSKKQGDKRKDKGAKKSRRKLMRPAYSEANMHNSLGYLPWKKISRFEFWRRLKQGGEKKSNLWIMMCKKWERWNIFGIIEDIFC